MTGDIVLGGAALFALALGMGVPLILVGMSAGEVLPKVGPWMASVNAFFGVVLLGVAIWIISPIIPVIAQMLLWAALLIISAMYLHALDPLPAGAGKGLRFWKGVGIIALISGIALLVGAYSGSRDILQPLTALRLASEGKTSAPRPDLPFYTVSTVAQLDDHLRQAAGTPVMVDFYAEWCVSCKELDRFTFSDPRVQEKLKTISLVRVDVTEGTMEQAALLKRFQLYGPPGIVFFDGNGNEIQSQRIIGYLDADRFLERLNSVLHGQEG
jgi:thiol:disulfide interchange protein DsbD